MKRPTRRGQYDLFGAIDIVPLSLPKATQIELAGLIKALLVEIVTYQRLMPMPQSVSQEEDSHGLEEDYS